jgi:hypothetical protein
LKEPGPLLLHLARAAMLTPEIASVIILKLDKGHTFPAGDFIAVSDKFLVNSWPGMFEELSFFNFAFVQLVAEI